MGRFGISVRDKFIFLLFCVTLWTVYEITYLCHRNPRSSNPTGTVTLSSRCISVTRNDVEPFSLAEDDTRINPDSWRVYSHPNILITTWGEYFPKNASPSITVTSPFLIPNRELCSDISSLTYVVTITTAPRNFDRRQTLRRTWANRTAYPNFPGRILFLLGAVLDKNLQNLIRNESNQFGDIVQGTFIDSFKNLTLKTVMGLRWISQHCTNAKFVVKSDDDVFVNMPAVAQYIFPLLATREKDIVCYATPRDPVLREGKWMVSQEYFRNVRFYPMPFCFGAFTFYTVSLAAELFEKAKVTPFFVLEDVFVYGILANQVGRLSIRDIRNSSSRFEFGTFAVSKKTPFIAGVITADDDLQKLWNGIGT